MRLTTGKQNLASIGEGHGKQHKSRWHPAGWSHTLLQKEGSVNVHLIHLDTKIKYKPRNLFLLYCIIQHPLNHQCPAHPHSKKEKAMSGPHNNCGSKKTSILTYTSWSSYLLIIEKTPLRSHLASCTPRYLTVEYEEEIMGKESASDKDVTAPMVRSWIWQSTLKSFGCILERKQWIFPSLCNDIRHCNKSAL